MYDVYLGTMLCPIAPQTIQVKVKNKNSTLTLINDGEINILKKAGLTEISFDLLLPNVKHPFAVYKSGFQNASYFLGVLETLKTSQKPFKFKVIRQFPNGKMLFSTNITVSLEDYSYSDDTSEGFDITASVKLKQYKAYGTKTCNVKFVDSKPKIEQPKETRASAASIASTTSEVVEKPVGIGSEVIVNGRLHSSSYGDSPGQTKTNYRGRINFVNLQGSHPYHVTTPDGGWLGWVTKDSVKAV